MNVIGFLIEGVVLGVLGTVVLVHRDRPTALRALMVGGAALRLGAMLFQHLVLLPRYNGGDVKGYLQRGGQVAGSLPFGPLPEVRGVPGTGVIDISSGVVQYFVGSSPYAVSLVFAFLSWLGMVLVADSVCWRYGWNRAAQLASALVFLTPSGALWTSVVGKDALVVLGSGAVVSALVRGRQPRFLLGIVLVALVRPHIAGMLLIAVVVSAGSRRWSTRTHSDPSRLRRATFVVVSLMLLLAGSRILASYAETSLTDPAELGQRLDRLEEATGSSGSVGSPFISGLPQVVRAVLVPLRPLPFEARDLVQVVTAAEALAVVVLAVRIVRPIRLRSLAATLREDAVARIGAVFIVLFCFVFAQVSNLGLLSRQRIQAMSIAMVVAVALAARGSASEDAPADRGDAPAPSPRVPDGGPV